LRKRLARIFSFSSGETDKFSTTKCEGSDNKYGAETLEAVVKSSRIVPVLCSNIALWSGSSAINDYTEDDESNATRAFDDAKDKFD
jgi:hypothetical protein